MAAEDELKKTLPTVVLEKKDPRRRWIDRMIRSAKSHHKICPYFDKRLGNCFLRQLTDRRGKCEREGKFDGCNIFLEFLEQTYDKLVRNGKQLPVDFRDLPITIY